MSDVGIVFSIVGAIVLLFIWDRLPVVIVAMGTALALWATGILDLGQALAGFGDPAVMFIVALFVVSAGLEATGVTAWAGQLLIASVGESRTRLLVLTMLVVALLTALISLNGAVAALLPVVVVTAIRLRRSPSQLLMPFVFAGHAGSLLTLTGTPVNVLVSDAAADAGLEPFGYFEFALVGVPLVIGVILIAVLFGKRLLPERTGRSIPPDLSRHARTLVEQYRLDDGTFQLRIRPSSPYAGAARNAIDLGGYPGLALIAVQAADRKGPGQSTLAEGDVLVVRGDAQTAGMLAADKHLAFRSPDEGVDIADALFNRASGLAEVVIPPRSGLIGQRVFPGMVARGNDLVVLAVQRRGEDRGPGETELAPGDSLLLQGSWKALDEHLPDPDVLVVNSPELVRRQAVPMGAGAYRAVGVLAAMVVLLATGVAPPAVAGLLAAGAMILLGVLTVEQTYRAIDWTTVILIGAMMPLSTAMSQSGAANLLADLLVDLVGGAGPYAVLAGFFVLTAVLGQLISNTATALIIIPVCVVAAGEVGMSLRPVLMSLAVAAAASFLTPVATPTNLMVMGPAGYQFGDYWKLGLPMMLWFFVVATFLVPVIWPF